MSHTEQPNDPLRHPGRYMRLVQALAHARREMRVMEQSDVWDIESFVTRFLPDIADALDAEHTFLAKEVVGEKGRRWLELIATYPRVNLNGRRLRVFGRLHALMEQGRSRVIAPLGEAIPTPIVELKVFDATSAILTCLRNDGTTYVVGVCNRRDAAFGPYLAPDRMTLEHILDLVISALRSGTRRRLELESIQRISERVTSGDLHDVYQQIVYEAVTVTQTLYAALWQVNKNEARLDFVAAQHATEPTWQPRKPSLLLDPSSLNGFVALSQAPHYVTNVADEEHYLAWDAATTAAFCVPLLYHNHVLGTLDVASAAAEGISPEDRRFIRQLAPHAAIALHNARMLEIHQRVIAFQQNTADILPLAEELDQIHQELAKYVDAGGLFIARIDESQGVSFPLAYHWGRRVAESAKGRGHWYGPQRLGRVRGMVEWIVRERRPLLVRDFGADPLAAEIAEAARPGVVSCVVLPITSAGRTIGAIGLRSYDPALRFDDYDAHFLAALASYLAVVIENSDSFDRTLAELQHSYDESRRRVAELQAVSRFQEQISNLSETEGAELQQIYTEATAALRAVDISTDNLLLALYRSDTQLVEFPLVYERGLLLSEAQKAADPAFRRRQLGTRRDIIDWMLTNRHSHLGRTRAEIQGWVNTLTGLAVAPTRSYSWLGAPMLAGGELIGVIALRDLDREGVFQERHCELVKTIAGQAAIAIQNARLYAREKERAEELDALYTASRAITAAGVDRDAVLQAILEQAVRVTGAHFGTLQLKQDDYLEFVAAWPLSERARLQEKYGLMPIDGQGITARVARQNHYVLAPDVTQEPDYEPGADATRSELAVSLRRGGEKDGACQGVLNVEHREVGGLGAQHVQTLINLSNLAVVAIQNARQAEELTRTNAIAIMGAWGADLVHDVNKEVANIRRAVQILLDRSDLPSDARPRLQQIEQYAADMALPELPEEPPQLGEAIALRNAPNLDAVLHSELIAYRRRHSGVAFDADLGCGDAKVAIHQAWLRKILRHFLNNAIRATIGASDKPWILVATRINGEMSEITVTDNGKGVREEIKPYLFRRPIVHSEPRLPERPGRGLLLVDYVTKFYGGECKLDWSQTGKGTRFLIRIPLALGTQVEP